MRQVNLENMMSDKNLKTDLTTYEIDKLQRLLQDFYVEISQPDISIEYLDAIIRELEVLTIAIKLKQNMLINKSND